MKKLLSTIIIAAFAALSMNAQKTLYSTGGASGAALDWGTLGTFNDQADGSGTDFPPTANDNVIIQSTHVINLAGPVGGCKDLSVENTAVLGVSPGATLLIVEDLTIRNGALVELLGQSGGTPGAKAIVERDLNLFGDGSGQHTAFIIGDGAILRLIGTTPRNIALLDAEEMILGPNGILEIGSASNTADYSITHAPGASTGKLSFYGVLAPIDGDLETNGLLTLKATSPTEYARVALNDGKPIATRDSLDGTITGNITMEQVLTTGNLISSAPSGGFYSGKWFQFAFPLRTTDLKSGWGNNGTDRIFTLNTTGNASTQNIWWWDGTGQGTSTEVTVPGTSSNAQAANGWTATIDNITTDPKWDDRGYTIFLTSDNPFKASQTISLTGTADLRSVNFRNDRFGDDNIHLTWDPAIYPQDANGNITGPPNPLPTTEDALGWNLLWNPYPTSIDTDSWLNFTDGGVANGDFEILSYPAVHVWNTTAGHYEGWTTTDVNAPSFGIVTYNTAGGVATSATTPSADKFNIPPFQSFWVKTFLADESAGAQVKLNRLYTETRFGQKVFHKTASGLPETAVLFAYDTDSIKDITLIYYSANSTMQMDGHGDIYKLMSIEPGVPNLYIEEAGSKAQSAGRPFKATDTVNVFYESIKNNTTAYLWLNDTNISSTYSITLLDKLTQQTQDMRANPTYQFSHNTNNDPDRFQLIISNSAFDITENPTPVNPINVYTTSNEELAIASTTYSGPAYIAVFDMAGRLVMTRKVELTEGVTNHVQMPGLANSIYSVKLEFDGRTMVEKIVR